MSRLTQHGRTEMPKSKFAGPGRSYPVENKSHAVAAKADSTRAVNAGRMSSSEKAKIDAKADKVLKK